MLARPLNPELRGGRAGARPATSIAAGVFVLVSLSFAIRIDPGSAEVSAIRAAHRAMVHTMHGMFQANRGDFDGALADLDEAIRLHPKLALIYVQRGRVWEEKRNYDRAIADYERGVELAPKDAGMHNDLAWLLATAELPSARNGARAVQLALKACELSQWKNAAMLDTLAAAYARQGDYVKAAEWEQKAIEIVDSTWSSEGRERGRSRLQLYRDGKAWPAN
jgi:tetratricopeptide (TPR) repeat protein